MILVSPAGHWRVRNDARGYGIFGASRDGGVRLHKGVDLEIIPGQDVVAPIPGIINREIIVYADDPRWRGVEIRGHLNNIETIAWILYVEVGKNKILTRVTQGEPIGVAQNVSRHLTHHIHLEICVNPLGLLKDHNL